jgi:hypothetical protein
MSIDTHASRAAWAPAETSMAIPSRELYRDLSDISTVAIGAKAERSTPSTV